ncbi:MAG: M48 family metalloprotease [Treponema sp.]|jgi:predicted Zn-dependent protease|nr:M48 family metalloprotease [Treponema sp.]
MKKSLVFLCVFGCLFVQAVFSGGSSANQSTQPSAAERLGSAQSRANEALAGMDRAFTEADSEPTLQDLYFIGRAVAANILTIYKPYNVNAELTRYLNLICQAIVINNPEIGLFDGSYVIILDSPELNALASPGGHIFITKGLVEAAASEDMLAAIIAHELAHIKLKHGMKMIEDMRFYDNMTAIMNRAYEFSGRNSSGAQSLMDFRASVATMVDTMVRDGYSYSQEFEADQEALSLLAATGYDPGALREVLNMLQRTQSSGSRGLDATHPSPVERIRNIERWLIYYRVQDNRRYRTARFIND